MEPNELARAWRAEKGYIGRGGVIVLFDGVANGWVSELRDPDHWRPGCIAVDESGNQWASTGGTFQRGAVRWEPIPTTESE